jgi:hypothetical protein
VANRGTTQSKGVLNYTVANTSTLFDNTDAPAYNDIAGPADSSSTSGGVVGFGLSTFFGRNMYILFNGKTAHGEGFGGTASTTVTGPINGIEAN